MRKRSHSVSNVRDVAEPIRTPTSHTTVMRITLFVVAMSVAPAANAAEQPRPGATGPGWSRVRAVKPGTPLDVTLKGLQPRLRYFVSADDTRLLVLNLTDRSIPEPARKLLLDLAAGQPDYFSPAVPASAFVAKDVRIEGFAVQMQGRTVADLRQIVETIEPQQVAEILRPREAGVTVARGAGWGLLIGTVAGCVLGMANAGSGPDGGLAVMGGIFYGAILGTAGGAAIGGIYHSQHQNVTELVYRSGQP